MSRVVPFTIVVLFFGLYLPLLAVELATDTYRNCVHDAKLLSDLVDCTRTYGDVYLGFAIISLLVVVAVFGFTMGPIFSSGRPLRHKMQDVMLVSAALGQSFMMLSQGVGYHCASEASTHSGAKYSSEVKDCRDTNIDTGNVVAPVFHLIVSLALVAAGFFFKTTSTVPASEKDEHLYNLGSLISMCGLQFAVFMLSWAKYSSMKCLNDDDTDTWSDYEDCSDSQMGMYSFVAVVVGIIFALTVVWNVVRGHFRGMLSNKPVISSIANMSVILTLSNIMCKLFVDMAVNRCDKDGLEDHKVFTSSKNPFESVAYKDCRDKQDCGYMAVGVIFTIGLVVVVMTCFFVPRKGGTTGDHARLNDNSNASSYQPPYDT